jgi:hypothetical protein
VVSTQVGGEPVSDHFKDLDRALLILGRLLCGSQLKFGGGQARYCRKGKWVIAAKFRNPCPCRFIQPGNSLTKRGQVTVDPREAEFYRG